MVRGIVIAGVTAAIMAAARPSAVLAESAVECVGGCEGERLAQAVVCAAGCYDGSDRAVAAPAIALRASAIDDKITIVPVTPAAAPVTPAAPHAEAQPQAPAHPALKVTHGNLSPLRY